MARRVLTLCLLFLFAAIAGSEEKMPEPRYNASGELLMPEGYREWMFVGANLDMGYSEGGPPPNSMFHNIYIQRQAYQQYVKTGKFPDKTMLVMENLSAGGNASINKRGKFEDKHSGIEVALKDEKRFPEKWAYFIMFDGQRKPLASAKAMAKDRCWKCHNEHAAVDNVFLQFYPVLRDARPLP